MMSYMREYAMYYAKEVFPGTTEEIISPDTFMDKVGCSDLKGPTHQFLEQFAIHGQRYTFSSAYIDAININEDETMTLVLNMLPETGPIETKAKAKKSKPGVFYFTVPAKHRDFIDVFQNDAVILDVCFDESNNFGIMFHHDSNISVMGIEHLQYRIEPVARLVS